MVSEFLSHSSINTINMHSHRTLSHHPLHRLLVLFIVIMMMIVPVHSNPSSYVNLSSNVCHPSSLLPYQLASIPFNLLLPTQLLLTSDGSFYPDGKVLTSSASIWMEINGNQLGNVATIEWASSNFPSQHSYSLIGCTTLGIGSYTLKLMAQSKSTSLNATSSLCVAAGSNLALFATPSANTECQSLTTDSDVMTFPILPHQRYQPVPHKPLLELNFPPCERVTDESSIAIMSSSSNGKSNSSSGKGYGNSACDIITLASATLVQHAGGDGSAMMGLYMNAENAGNDESMWAVQDLSKDAELAAPIYAHGLFIPGRTTPTSISLDASAFPPSSGSNGVAYVVSSGATLVTLRGGFKVYGSYSQSADQDDWWDYICAGTSHGEQDCPPATGKLSDALVLADVNFTLPLGHSGMIMFMAKSRVAGGVKGDGGGLAWLQLEIDGALMGSVSVQQLTSSSQGVWPMRTLTCSYFSALPNGTPLKSGVQHRVRVLSSARGDFQHINNVKDVMHISQSLTLFLDE